MVLRKKKVIVGISGGVDSSVTIYVLLKMGYKVLAIYMKNWEENSKKCNFYKDLYDSKNVCFKFNVIFKKINFSSEYWENVFVMFLKEYNIGNTPNPDVLCNKEIKFKIFLNFAINNFKADYISTGHYSYIKKIKNHFYMLCSFDKNKDQSYFLHNVNTNLNQILFPVCFLKKIELRYIARKLKLINYKKKDSTGICFIGKKNFNVFINSFLYIKPGFIITKNSQIVGIHKGIINYTIGQRKGLNIGSINKNKNPWYVIEKIQNNIIIVQNKKHYLLNSKNLITKKIYWNINKVLLKPLICFIKTRYKQKSNICVIIPIDSKYVIINFKKPIISITKGQFVVFYLGEFCLGGGIIKFKTFL
ncbi:MAG: tRNA 2-thiouridine(34) synthase MnmA [Enterobacteriaceae bacterium PSmelAO3-2]|nr:tRNA 2-thiouridine(34) synthase MnmA [Enterobacteriaceae bacterium Cmel17]WMC17512.1 MAG: tRNA 2-thiouridine(34) synthase MnmA [Enterobacteriaceae bacterium Cmel21]WMC17719.1 MAG: tRNA 2-thiouridine(34) synthase MnmA [Enterobacteriaceae bacterium PSmelAO3-2]WMC17923.1 MAG: tRNA 2-thiouridine(34) synthase MnmA [Enterobacteriaceae bacterium PSmelAO3-1]WMC18126.1 MAG: tRNA 2-thiouridine(34) synthase MnmA [Enterobacteriaceae bacterium PSmelAO1]